MLPFDVLEVVFSHLDLYSLGTARSVCFAWAEIGRQDVVITATVANTRSKLTHAVVKRGLGLTDAQVHSLRGKAYISRRGHACRLYEPKAIIQGLKMRGGGRRRVWKRKKPSSTRSTQQCCFQHQSPKLAVLIFNRSFACRITDVTIHLASLACLVPMV